MKYVFCLNKRVHISYKPPMMYTVNVCVATNMCMDRLSVWLAIGYFFWVFSLAIFLCQLFLPQEARTYTCYTL